MTDCPPIPQLSDEYRCVEDYFETFVRIYDEHFSRQYGFWRPYFEQVIHRYLDCGDLHNGFARVIKIAGYMRYPHLVSKLKILDL